LIVERSAKGRARLSLERKGPEASLLPARAISIKNKHLLVIYSIPARGFTAALSVFGGTPPPKPLNCKSVSNHRGALISNRWADPTGEEPWFLGAILSFVLSDIIKTSFYNRSQLFTFRCRHSPSAPEGFRGGFQGNKKPCSHEASRVWKSYSILYLPASGLAKSVSGD
jgi:hypothetical protein